MDIKEIGFNFWFIEVLSVFILFMYLFSKNLNVKYCGRNLGEGVNYIEVILARRSGEVV